MKILRSLIIISGMSLFFLNACTKDSTTVSTSALYTPTSADVTTTATLADLQQGRTLYVNHCGACHQLYSPDSFTASQWKSILNGMVPKTSLGTTDAALVSKYVTRGK